MKARSGWRLSTAIAGMLLLTGTATSTPAAEKAAAAPAATDQSVTIRLSPSQYRQTIADLFGSAVRVNGRFEPEQRDQGLLAIGARVENFTDSGFEVYYRIGRDIAGQVVDEKHRKTLIGCEPKNEAARDDQCAKQFFSRLGPALYRRPLTDAEVNRSVVAAGTAADSLKDFYSGMRLSLGQMMVSPNFLWRFRGMEADPKNPNQKRMNAYNKAAQLSYVLWNTTPDQQLMLAAKNGQLDTPAGLSKEVDRMLQSPRVADGVRAFFADMLSFSDFDHVAKDPIFFPRYTQPIRDQAQEQTLRTIVDHVVSRHGDYRDLFTTPQTFLTVDLGALYGVPVVDTTDNGQPQRWIPHNYAAGDARAGLLSQASFTTLWSPAARTSPTERGKALRQQLLCQKVPPPPGNVEFKFVDDTSNPLLKTTRQRLEAHVANPVCAGCHKLMDPLGLALENFNSGGEYRDSENGIKIDATGELNGKRYDGPLGLGKVLHDDPAVTNCVATRAFAYATGYMPPTNDPRWTKVQQSFVASKYDVIELLRAVATSDLAYSPLTQ